MTAEINYEVLPASEAYRIIAVELWRSLKDLSFHRTRRDANKVKAEYNLGTWKSVLDEKRWLKCANVRDYVGSKDEQLKIAKIRNRLVRIQTSDYYDYRRQVLQKTIEEYAGSEQEIFELGCGYGLNLFSLSLANRWNRLIGFDISENGVAAARQAAEYFKLDNLRFDILDLTNPSDPNFGVIEGKVIYTYYCLEQLKYSTAQVVGNIIRAGAKRVIHIEPTTELLHKWAPMDLINYFYIIKQDYQNNLVTTLKDFERRGKIRILDLKRLYYAPTHRNDPTLACWEPVA